MLCYVFLSLSSLLLIRNDRKCFPPSESSSSRSSRDSTATGIGVPVAASFISKIRRGSASSSCSVHHDRRHSFSPEFSSSPEESVFDDPPSLTISLKKLEDVVNEDMTSDTNIGVLFVRAENLKRGLNSSLMAENLSQFKSYLKTKGSQRKRAYSGVFARIFRSQRIEETIGATIDSVSSPTSSCNSSEDDVRRNRRQEAREELLLETPVHTSNSCSSSIIDFTWSEVILKASDFPVRLSLYDVDRNKVRICLGHALLSRKFLEQQCSSQGIITGNEVASTHILHPTISSASISPNEGENNQHQMQQ